MKLRKGYRVTDSQGFTWYGDCPKWAREWREAGAQVESARIMAGTWQCSGCVTKSRSH